MKPPFAIFALPRSRTAWVSRFLTHGDWVCVHDSMTQLPNLKELRTLLAMPDTGIIETGMAFAAPVIRRYFPECRVAVIRRPVAEVRESLRRQTISYLPGELENIDAALDQLAADPETVSVTFDDLKTEEGCRRLSEHCVGGFDVDRWRRMTVVNIQIDIPARVNSLVDNAQRYRAFVQELRSLVARPVYRVERWDECYPDCLPLIERHREELGEAPFGMPFEPNLELAEALDKDGRAGFVVARAAGRMVGYCVFLISPSFESKNVLSATQGIFYVLPEFRHLSVGPRLFQAGVDEMKRRGVKMVYLRHGFRGSSPKLGGFFRHVGAKEIGRDYALWLGDTEGAA